MKRNPRIYLPDHLARVRQLPCLLCLDNTSTEACHIRYSDIRAAKINPGVGQKPHDYWVVPLCKRHHDAQHAFGDEYQFWAHECIDPLFIAMALYLNSGDQEACEQIIHAQH